jgi:predicted component of type VI protein secretion system
MQVVLVMFRPDGQRRSFSISRDVTVIGRREDCDFRIPLGEVSRKHCRVIRNGETVKVEDLGSSNGTFCNGMRVQEADLNPGDTLQVGPAVFVVQIDGSPMEDEMNPVTAEAAAAAAAAEAAPPSEAAEIQAASEEPAAPDESGVDQLETTSTPRRSRKDESPTVVHSESNGEFDPMSVLEGNDDSGVLPEIGESVLGESAVPPVDESEESHQDQNA